jgi:hypothetical protein
VTDARDRKREINTVYETTRRDREQRRSEERIFRTWSTKVTQNEKREDTKKGKKEKGHTESRNIGSICSKSIEGKFLFEEWSPF